MSRPRRSRRSRRADLGGGKWINVDIHLSCGAQTLGATGRSTTYELMPTENLPLLQPLVNLGNGPGTRTFNTPIIDPIQPTLRVIVELGYDTPLS
jgi:hypothetical protein